METERGRGKGDLWKREHGATYHLVLLLELCECAKDRSESGGLRDEVQELFSIFVRSEEACKVLLIV